MMEDTFELYLATGDAKGNGKRARAILIYIGTRITAQRQINIGEGLA